MIFSQIRLHYTLFHSRQNTQNSVSLGKNDLDCRPGFTDSLNTGFPILTQEVSI